MSLSIAINKRGGVFYMPGETIKGVLTADMDEPKTCDFLTIRVRGIAEVEIRVTTSSDGGSHTTYYRDEEIYLNETIKLFGAGTLQRGRTVFPFQFNLPTEGLPCTFSASHGSIAYNILAHMKRSLFKFDIRDEYTFVVGPMLDLNRVPLSDFGPIHYDEKHSVSGFCCCKGSKNVRLQVIVPKRYFIPGEFIRFKVIIENHSNSVLLSGIMKLALNVQCSAEGISRYDEKIFGQMAGPEVKPNCLQAWEVNNFMIPVLKPVGIPPSGLGGTCQIISTEYALEFNASTDDFCCGGSIHAYIPLVIGTIPPNTHY